MVGKADHGRILDGVVRAQKILDLHRIDVLAARDDDVLFAVHEIDEAVLVRTRHVARVKPAVFEDLGGGLGIVVVALHHARAPDAQLADCAGLYGNAAFIHNPDLPLVSGLADRAHLGDVFNAEVNTAGPDRFRKAVVGIVVVVRKMPLPALDQAGGNRLSADVHQFPLAEGVIFEPDVAAFDAVQNVLRPRHQKPDVGDALLGHRPDDPLGPHAAQQDGPACGKEAAEPVHLRAGVVQGRNAQKVVRPRLAVVVHLAFAGQHQGAVPVENRLRKTGGAGRKINSGVVIVGKRNFRRGGGTAGGERIVAFGKRGTALADKKTDFHVGNLPADRGHPSGELRPEDQDIAFGQIQAVFDLVFRVAVVERHRERAGFQNAEVDRQPLQAVHQQNADLVPLDQSPAQKKVGQAVGLVVKLAPRHFPPVAFFRIGFDQFVILPVGRSFLDVGIDFDEADFIAVQGGVTRENFRDGHG